MVLVPQTLESFALSYVHDQAELDSSYATHFKKKQSQKHNNFYYPRRYQNSDRVVLLIFARAKLALKLRYDLCQETNLQTCGGLRELLTQRQGLPMKGAKRVI